MFFTVLRNSLLLPCEGSAKAATAANSWSHPAQVLSLHATGKNPYFVKTAPALAAGCTAAVPVVQGAAAFLGIIFPRRSTDSQRCS